MKNHYAFIDGQNLHQGTANEGWTVDFERFRKYLSAKYGVSRAYFFMGYLAKHKKLYEATRAAGFEIIFKEVARKGKKIKGNVDAEIVLHAMDKLGDFDRAVLVTADGDFASLVTHLKNKGKLRAVLNPSAEHCSTLLRQAAGGKIQFLIDARKKIGKAR